MNPDRKKRLIELGAEPLAEALLELAVHTDPESKQAKKLIKELNGVYKQAIKQGEKMAEKDMQNALKKMAKKHAQLKKWKWKMRFSAVKRLFNIVKKAVTFFKPDPSTVSQIKAVGGILNKLYGIGKDLHTLFKSEKKSQNALNKALGKAAKRFDKAAKKMKKTTKWQDAKTLMGFDPLKDLKASRSVYKQKNQAADEKADKFGKKVQELVTEQDALAKLMKKSDKEVKKGLEDALKASETALADTLSSLDGINDSINSGKELLVESQELIKLMEDNATNAYRIRRGIDKLSKALGQSVQDI